MKPRCVMRQNQTRLLEAIHSEDPVAGFTHNFYKYPARFSPLFIRAMIQTFTKPGDLVYDPFMGGGTTLVEASALGRQAIGTDINSLAVFLARVKTRRFTPNQLSIVRSWAHSTVEKLQWWATAKSGGHWVEHGYQRNINSTATWRIRKLLEIGLAETEILNVAEEQQLARCILLRTAQWALDCRKDVPTPTEFRGQFLINAEEIVQGAAAYASAVKRERKALKGKAMIAAPICLHRSAIGVEQDDAIQGRPVSLVLTSPPYPGVHVLYHRWQVQGRRETPAPYWIANALDGHGASFYTFGDRQEPQLNSYFDRALAAFRSIARISNENTLVVQMLAFSEPEWQLPRYGLMMKRAGFAEMKFPHLANAPDGRVWRRVPNRKWYASQQGGTNSSNEVVLFYKLRRQGVS